MTLRRVSQKKLIHCCDVDTTDQDFIIRTEHSNFWQHNLMRLWLVTREDRRDPDGGLPMRYGRTEDKSTIYGY